MDSKTAATAGARLRGLRFVSSVRWCSLAIALLLQSPLTHATNGLNLIGFGPESNLMAGADTAVARDTGAFNTNPAGLAQIHGHALDVYGAVARALDVGHRDQFGNDVKVSNHYIGVGSFGYATRLAALPCTIGAGLFGQGGAGNVYRNVNTAFGTRDRMSSLFRIAKISPGFGCQLNKTWSLGASAGIAYADMHQKVFPGTSFLNSANPAQSFFGYELKSASALGTGFKLGAMAKLSDRITLALAYASKIDLPLDGGHLHANMGAAGLGLVTYRNTRIGGLAIAREVDTGAAWQVTDTLLLAVKVAWLDWSGALRNSTLRAARPDNPAAPPVLAQTARLDWKDQWVYAFGLDYALTSKTDLLAGYNYGANPIPAATTSPLLAAIGQHHFVCGFRHRLSELWTLNGGLEYDLGETVKYTNPELPFGVNAQESSEALIAEFALSRRW